MLEDDLLKIKTLGWIWKMERVFVMVVVWDGEWS